MGPLSYLRTMRKEADVPAPIWQWDETIQRGTDYEALKHVADYDRKMADLRDVEAEAEEVLDLLGVTREDVLLEVGTGTGAFARRAARRCQKVIALDVSETMLTYATQRTREEGINNIVFVRAGFLTYEHEGEPVAAVVSQLALHHLPDVWKLVALKRLRGLLRPGGRLHLCDVVFPDESQDEWDAYVETLLAVIPADQREEMACHIRQEFSTFDWVLREIIMRAGFSLESARLDDAFLGYYLCGRR